MNCPHCNEPKIVFEGGSFVYPKAKNAPYGKSNYLFFDGDSLRGMYMALLRKGLQKEVVEDEDLPWFAQLSFGRCSQCGEHYYAIGLALCNPSIAPGYDWTETYFRFNRAMPENTIVIENMVAIESNANCIFPHRNYTRTFTKYSTPLGWTHHYDFGLFPLERDVLEETSTSCGIASCITNNIWVDAEKFLLDQWENLVNALIEDNRQIPAELTNAKSQG